MSKETENKSFKELLQLSFKSNDTEEWLDVHFTRPIGLVFALFWNRLGVHPNVITILSIFLGVSAGVMFYYTDIWHNVCGVLLLMFANFCDSTDGQMARLTGKKTLIGRMLDGFSGDLWFASIYIAIAFRLHLQMIPFTDVNWGFLIWMIVIIAGLGFHSPQSSLSDYYRQIHLYFLKGKEGSELDNYKQQRKIYEEHKANKDFWASVFFYNYAKYCKSQEERTPSFQWFFKLFNSTLSAGKLSTSDVEEIKQEFLAGSRPLMKFTNILTFNTRAICIYITCLIDMPWIYPLFEITVMEALYHYMHNTHEKLCENLTKKIEGKAGIIYKKG